MSALPKSVSGARVQYAALPFRKAGAGTEVMLVTSRHTKRWIIPKGWPMGRKAPHLAAAQEAREEAGVVGRVGTSPIGSFSYEKHLKRGQVVVCEVLVFALEVERQQKSWPDKGKRRMRWLTPADAAAAVQDNALSGIILGLRTQTSAPAASLHRT
jgi:8-oxo-dGTP pyrophosphatase MutT (NUDIX family)